MRLFIIIWAAFGLRGSGGLHFNDNLLNYEFQKVRTSIRIDFAQMDVRVHFQNIKQARFLIIGYQDF